MRRSFILALLAVTAAPALAAAPSAAEDVYDAVNLRLVRVVGALEITPADVDRISVEYDPGAGLVRPATFAVQDGVLEINQISEATWREIWADCRGPEDAPELRFTEHPEGFWGRPPFRFFGRGERAQGVELDEFHAVADYGRLVIRVPRTAQVSVQAGGTSGRVGDVAALDLEVGFCGDLAVGAVAGALTVAINGMGDVRTGSVAGGFDATINGQGDIEIASVDGASRMVINGSGDIDVLAGAAPTLDVTIAGVGDVRFDGVVDQVTAEVHGAGDIYVEEVRGGVNARSSGAGGVHVGRYTNPPAG